MNNLDIREKAMQSNVKLWQIAEAIGMNDSSFSRKLRKELSEAEKQKVLEIIARLAGEK